MIDLEAILQKHTGDSDLDAYYLNVIDAMREACNQAIDACNYAVGEKLTYIDTFVDDDLIILSEINNVKQQIKP